MQDTRYLHLVRPDCPLPPGTHVVIYCCDSGGEITCAKFSTCCSI